MSTQGIEEGKKRSHRKPRAGKKAEKKKNKTKITDKLTARQRNPKAFAINSAVRAEKKFRRHQDLDTKKQHVPLVDRTPLEPPPIVVVVVGPPKVGKSTLIQCLIRNFTRQPLTNINGPVTVVSGKRRRITLIECNNDINSMIDLSKIADLVFLLIDGSFGFEMEIFEFLNICQVHGMPKVMGILTHLDMVKNNKTLKHIKKTLKHRFWTEVYPGAKLFYLSGILHGEYLRNEISRLGRFISVMKFRPLLWQTSHPYLIADRMEDLTSPELIRQNSQCDRIISLYGYIRGIPLIKNSVVHIPGCGDMKISDVCFLPDPCPLPDKLKKRTLVDKERLIYAPFSGVGGIVYDKDAVYIELAGSHSYHKNSEESKPDKELISSLADAKDTLSEKIERSTLQIFSNTKQISGKEFLQDTISSEPNHVTNGPIISDFEYPTKIKSVPGSVEVKTKFSNVTKFDETYSDYSVNDQTFGSDSSTSSKGSERTEDITQETDTFTDNANITADMNSNDDETDDDEYENGDSDEDDDDDDNDDKYEENNDDEDEENNDDEDDGNSNDIGNKIDEVNAVVVLQPNRKKSKLSDKKIAECTSLNWKSNLAQKAADAFIQRQNSAANLWKLVYGEEENEQYTTDEGNELAGGLFKVISEKHRQYLREKDTLNAEDCSKFNVSHIRDWTSDLVCDSIRNYFVTGKWKQSEDANKLLELDEELYGDFEDMETGEKYSGENQEGEDDVEKKLKTKSQLLEEKKILKEKFDAEYDGKDGEGGTYYDSLKQEVSKQAELNRLQFEGLDDDVRVQLEGYRPGMYIRIEIRNVPCELVTNFDPVYPLIVGGLQPGEENIGYINVRVKKHRWYSRILKTKNPVIFSIGWRRFQSLPIYSKLEDNFRNRMLKYTPQHVTCMAHFFGPLTPPGTGFLGIQDVSSQQEGFRITCTGTVIDCNQSAEITKKLKLIGEPYKIYKKTAFIKGMFNSSLEVAKFEGARIKTVSGIRGQIKKAVSKPEGAFRATFEDTIKLSDIVFCRTWVKVNVPKLYNPVTNLLLSQDKKSLWHGMKTSGQLKREKGMKSDPQLDSLYVPVVRKPKIFKPFKIPKRLQRQLPYKDRPKILKVGPKDQTKKNRVAIIRDAHEHKVANVMRMLRVNYNEKQRKQREEMKHRVREHKQKKKIEELQKNKKIKQRRKGLFIKQTKNAK